MPDPLIISEQEVNLGHFVAAARGEMVVALSSNPGWRQRMERSRHLLEVAASNGQCIYGVNTGFGRTSRRQVSEAHAALQKNLIRMHGCGVGPHFSEEEARAVMISRLVCLAKGYSGVRLALLEALVQLINSGLTPAIPAYGSVGASGDLTPLSYVGAVLSGERQAYFQGRLLPASAALEMRGLAPFSFEIKEALSLINGTSVMSAVGTLVAFRTRRLLELAERASALALEMIDGRAQAMHPAIHRAKPHPGQIASAERILASLSGSQYAQNGTTASHPGREVQDRYSIRCAPHVLGAARDALTWVEQILEIEINGVSDNPLVDPETGEILNGGNFYGGHVALAMDCIKNALGTVINLFDRQFAFLVSDANPPLHETLLPADWLPPDQQGLHHGLKALQITLSSLTALAQQRAFPDALMSRQTECDNQDVVSMGTNAAINARAILEFSELGLAAWLITLSQAAAIRGEGRLSTPGRDLVERIREAVPIVTEDRPLDSDIQRLVDELIASKRLLPLQEKTR